MQLCQSEWTVLQSLWERQPQTLMQLVEDLKVRAGWSASTSKTMAARMSEKGLLRYEGKPRRYYPNVTREEAGFEETEQLLSRAFGGRRGLLGRKCAVPGSRIVRKGRGGRALRHFG